MTTLTNKLKTNLTLNTNKQNSKESLKNVNIVSKSKEHSSLKQIKKKRTALENISNAASVAKDGTKKSRFNPVFGIGKKDTKLNTKLVANITKKNDPQKVMEKENHDSHAKQCNSELSIQSSVTTTSTICSNSEIIDISEKTSELNNALFSKSISDLHTVIDWEDIDSIDCKDEFNMCDYAAYIFKYYRAREEKFPIDDYLKSQPTINKQMRHLLIDWMVEVQQQLEFNHEVLYLSVKLLDLYLNSKKIDKEKLQLLGGAAMFIACKYEERIPPVIDDFIYVSDNAYDRVELIKMEIDILKTVRFDIGVPLSYTFLRRYAKCVHADMKFLTLARYILELVLQDYSFAYVKDSLKACAALYLALKITHYNDQQTNAKSNVSSTDWNATLIHYTEYFLRDFLDYISTMNNLIKNAPNSKYKTIFKKYSHQVFYEVAKIPPLNDNELNEILLKAE